jgi:hypothetical protein
MKKSFSLVLGGLILFGLAAVSFANQQSKAAPVQHKVFVGTVDTVTMGDAATQTKSTIVVMDKQSVSKTFIVVATTKILDAKGVALTLDKLQKGQDVTVKYKTTPGGEQAVSVKLLK